MKRLKIILVENHTLHEMMIGIIAVNAVILAFTFLADDRKKAVWAVAAGTVTALFFVIYMACSIDDAMSLGEKEAALSMRKHMIIRYVIVCIVVAALAYFKIADPVFMVLSVLTVKAGAYMQPLVHRIFRRKDIE